MIFFIQGEIIHELETVLLDVEHCFKDLGQKGILENVSKKTGMTRKSSVSF